MKILILAGGSGTRLWPLSREVKPKHVVVPFGNSSLLKETFERAKKMARPKDILVVCGEAEKQAVAKEVKGLPAANIFAEPARSGTAAAIMMSAKRIAEKNPDEPLVIISSDSYVTDVVAYSDALKAGIQAVIENPKHLVLIGAQPTYPELGYGYISKGQHVWTAEQGKVKRKVYAVEGFIAKPDISSAEKMVAAKTALWNAGIFIARTAHFISLIECHMPSLGAFFKKPANEIKKKYAKLPNICINKGVLEKESRLLVVPVECGWIDVGTWQAVADTMERRGKKEGDNYLNIDSEKVQVINNNKKKIVAVVGLEDVVIVDTDDVLLVTSRKHGSRVRDIIPMLKKQKKYASYL